MIFLIENIEVSNWKAFKELQLSFSEGINFISGPNAIGKSSILQAICAAFTGRVPNGFELRNFIRRGTDLATIRVKFRIKNELLCVERSLSTRGRERCSISDLKGREIFVGGWEEVTKYVENLFEIQTFLFDKILFMSEGDVYRTIREPPGKQLLNEIHKLLGITQLQSLAKEVFSAKSEFQEERMNQMETFEKVKTRIETKEDLRVLENRLSKLQRFRDLKREELDALTRDLWEFQSELRRKEVLLDDLILLDSEEKKFAIDKIKAETLQKQLNQILEEIEAITHERLESEAEVSNLEKIVDIVNQAQKLEEISIKCPICRRPISVHEINEIKDELASRISSQKSRIQELLKRSNEINTKRKNIELELDELKEKEIRLKTLKEKHKKENKKVDETQKKIVEIKNKIEFLAGRKKELERALVENEAEIGNLREKIGKIKALEQYEDLEIAEVTENLKMASKGEYLSEFTSKGIEELIRRQRDSELREKLYKYISDVWSNFKGEKGWTVKLDSFAVPVPQLESEEYQFPLLSGGEKTALLVVTRTMLSRLLAKDVGFLLLDEPLEHLDARNRHSLLQFLVDAYTEKIVDQLIVTTTESSLLRKFIDNEKVKIIQLESLKT